MQIFFTHVEILKDSSAKYYQDNKERLQEKAQTSARNFQTTVRNSLFEKSMLGESIRNVFFGCIAIVLKVVIFYTFGGKKPLFCDKKLFKTFLYFYIYFDQKQHK